MYADLDELVLSGRLFNGDSRSSSPARSPSPDHSPVRDWPGASENGGGADEDGDGDDSDAERERRIAQIMRAAPQDAPAGSIGMGPGRTGVKGVIRDRAEAQARARVQRAAEVAEMNRRMEKASLGGKTFLEEERERVWEQAMLEGLPSGVEEARLRAAVGKGRGRFGHLREVGVKNFVSAVEEEARGVWVVVHLYEPSVDRCYTLDTELSLLARLHPDVKLLRARAASLGFASSSSSSTRFSSSLSRGISTRGENRLRPIADEDEDDPYAYDEKDSGDGYQDDDEQEEGNVDLDMLPTLLAYRDGALVHTWVRVDWEAGRAGVGELLSKHHILQGSGAGLGNCGLPSDDDDYDDLDLWEEDD